MSTQTVEGKSFLFLFFSSILSDTKSRCGAISPAAVDSPLSSHYREAVPKTTRLTHQFVQQLWCSREDEGMQHFRAERWQRELPGHGSGAEEGLPEDP